MKTPATSIFLAAALAATPVARLQAKDHDDHEHHVSTAEKVLAGLAIAGLAAAAAHANGDNGYYDDGQRTVSVTIYTRNGPTPIFLRPAGSGFIGPRGEFYPSLPREATLARVYGDYAPRPTQWPGGGGDRSTPSVQKIQGGLRITRNGRSVATIHTAMANVEKWKLDNDDTQIIVKSRGNHGPAMVEKFNVQTGTLLDKVMAFDIKRSNVRWARGFED